MVRFSRAWWPLVAIAAMMWCVAWPGGAFAQDPAIPFRPACALVAPQEVSAILGVEVIQEDVPTDALCSFLEGGQPVATVFLRPTQYLPLERLFLRGATDTTVGGLPALSSTRGRLGAASAIFLIGLPDGGSLEVEVASEFGVASPLAAARALAESILAAGPVTAQAFTPAAPAIDAPGTACELVTVAELTQLTGRRFTLDTPRRERQTSCRYRSKDQRTVVGVGVGPMELIFLRSDATTDLTISDRQALFVPDLDGVVVDLGLGRALIARIVRSGAKLEVDDVAALTTAIAEMAMGRMVLGTVTCPLITTDAVVRATGLDLEPTANQGPDSCWFVTPDRQTGLLVRIWDQPILIDSNARNLPAPTDLEVAGRPASGTTSAGDTVLSVKLGRVGRRDHMVLDTALLGAQTSATDPLAALETIAADVLAGR